MLRSTRPNSPITSALASIHGLSFFEIARMCRDGHVLRVSCSHAWAHKRLVFYVVEICDQPVRSEIDHQMPCLLGGDQLVIANPADLAMVTFDVASGETGPASSGT